MFSSRTTKTLVVAALLLVPGIAFADLVQMPTGPVATAAPSTYLTNILRAFTEALKDTSRGAAVGGLGLTTVLMSWAVSQAAAKMALRAALSQYVWPLAAAFVYAMFAFNAPAIGGWFADGLAAAASGSTVSGGVLSNPSQLMTKAIELTSGLFKTLAPPNPEAGFIDSVKTNVSNAVAVAEQWPVLLASLLLFFGFLWTAVTGIGVVVYAHAKVIVGTLLTPWLVLPITRPIGMTGVALIVSAAIELAVQSAIIGVGFKVLQGFSLAPEADFQAILETAGGALTVAFVCSGASAAVSMASRLIKMF